MSDIGYASNHINLTMMSMCYSYSHYPSPTNAMYRLYHNLLLCVHESFQCQNKETFYNMKFFLFVLPLFTPLLKCRQNLD